MIVSISTVKSCELVKGSKNVIQVAVSVSPQVQPLILTFDTLVDATSFVSRCYSDDGAQFVSSVMRYLDTSKQTL